MDDVALPRLCVFARAPVSGRTKERLARHIGAQAAFDAYCVLVGRLLDSLANTKLSTELWVDGDTDDPLIQQWARRYRLPVVSQPGGGLGDRMHEAIRRCRAAGRAGIVIGSDLPAVDTAYVESAAALLRDHDAVIGPAEDGGYALIGMHRPNPAVFSGIDWGTEAVYAQTRAKLDALGLRVGELPMTWDVDTLADWRRFLRCAPGSGAGGC